MSKSNKKTKKTETINLATDISALNERILKLKSSDNLNEQIKVLVIKVNTPSPDKK